MYLQIILILVEASLGTVRLLLKQMQRNLNKNYFQKYCFQRNINCTLRQNNLQICLKGLGLQDLNNPVILLSKHTRILKIRLQKLKTIVK